MRTATLAYVIAIVGLALIVAGRGIFTSCTTKKRLKLL
jgi:hypothetical protein